MLALPIAYVALGLGAWTTFHLLVEIVDLDLAFWIVLVASIMGAQAIQVIAAHAPEDEHPE